MEELPGGKINEMLSIEILVPDDIAETSRLLASMDPWLRLGYRRETLSYYLLCSDPSLSRYLVRIDGKPSGAMSVRFPWLSGPFLELIAIADGCRGKGVGRALIGWICARFSTASNLWTTVSSFNTEAQRFYEHMGFERSVVLQDLIRTGWDEILLRKRL
ncbi:MAG: GNAT family N-acetyltransferase [Syntrophobacteraceae bacterium]